MSPPPFTLGWVHNLEITPSSTNAGRVIGLAVSFSAIAVLSVVGRVAVRYKFLKVIGPDDLAVAASTLLGIAYSGIAIYQTRWGLGLAATDFPLDNAITYSKVQYTGGPIYCLAILGFKVSLLASYLRLGGFNKAYRIIIFTVMGLVIANQLIYTFLLSFGCHPVAKVWDPALEGTCINQLASYFGLGGSSLGFDLLIIALPFPILQGLKLDARKKIAVGVLFALGLFVTIIQIFRMHTIAKLKAYTDSEAIIEWSIVEINLGVLVACVPSFAPLLRMVGQKGSRAYHSHAQSRRKTLGAISSGAGLDHSARSHSGKRDSTKKHLDSEDDAVQLWEMRQDWTGGEANWSKDVPRAVIRAQNGPDGSISDDNSAEHRRHECEGDIHVIREFSISSHYRKP